MAARRYLIASLSIAGLVGLAAYAYLWNRAPTGPAAPSAALTAPAKPPAVGVEAVPVIAASMPEDVIAVGTLKSNESVVLRPEIAGRIATIRFREGSAVAKGEVLMELDASTQQAELAQARANLSLAKANFQRTEDLFRRKFVSERAKDEAAANLEVAAAAAALAEARLSKTTLRAPFAGIVGIREVSPGDYVKEGEELVNVEDIRTLKVDFRLPEAYLDRIHRGQTLEVTSDALPGRRFAATVDAIDPLVDAQGRSVVLRARLDNADAVLRPGMFARVRLILAERRAVPVVPEEALVSTAEGQFVFVVDGDKARRVPVKIGLRRNARVEVVEGLQPGDVVVTAGQLKLRDGSEVKVAGSPAAVAAGAEARPTRTPN